jgi:hypothetical protein
MARKWVPATDAEIDREIAEARRRGTRILSTTEPRASSVHLDRSTSRLEIELRDGSMVAIPTRLIQGLRGKSAAAIAKVQVMGDGYALHWDEIDAHHTVASLVAGRLGSTAWMREHARAAGSVRSEAKARAARRNGKKGGRPKSRT